mmetsp:Transcript_46230/g.133159  ORF Transcript_46230/g.133159 Transcript_46230/m.133159 type:complete len:224 (+) Transcript_46230:372-1043(+)
MPGATFGTPLDCLLAVRRAPLPLREEVVRRGDMIVLPHAEALLGVVAGQGEARELLQHLLVQRHLRDAALRVVFSELPRGHRDLGVPRVLPHLWDGQPPGRIRVQNACDKVGEFRRNEVWKLISSAQDQTVQHRRVGILEREVATDEGEQNDAAAPHVASLRGVSVTRDHLRRRVARGPTRRAEQLALAKGVAQAKVDDLYVPVAVQQQILRLQVPVNDAKLV